MVSALVRLADPGDEATSECCAAALYLFFCHPDVLALIDGREVEELGRGEETLDVPLRNPWHPSGLVLTNCAPSWCRRYKRLC